ncbi:hypothetical protein DFH06DRAFT_1347973 [Mycena polygramma]|nr:hypothetical protein DFH06DRAFT_1347973 [Mycena polygramma]
MALDSVNCFTRSPLFHDYPWRSDSFIDGTWANDASKVDQFKNFAKFLEKLDQNAFPRADSLDYDKATLRALLGLPNVHNIQVQGIGLNSKAVYACWTTLLRFQVLDLLLSVRNGVSDVPSPVCPPPTGEGPSSLLKALAKWPEHLQMLKKARSTEKKKREKTATQTPAQVEEDEDVNTTFEAIAPVQVLSGMRGRTLTSKTYKNIQAMGAALMWVMESRALPDEVWPGNKFVAETYTGMNDSAKGKLRRMFNDLTLTDLLRPLSYGLNYAFVAVFCNFDLQNPYGNLLSQYQARSFIGRYRTARLAHVEDAIISVIRLVAIGETAESAMDAFFEPAMELIPSDEAGDTSLFDVPEDVAVPNSSSPPLPLPPPPPTAPAPSSPTAPAASSHVVPSLAPVATLPAPAAPTPDRQRGPIRPRTFPPRLALPSSVQLRSNRTLAVGLATGLCQGISHPGSAPQNQAPASLGDASLGDDGLYHFPSLIWSVTSCTQPGDTEREKDSVPDRVPPSPSADVTMTSAENFDSRDEEVAHEMETVTDDNAPAKLPATPPTLSSSVDHALPTVEDATLLEIPEQPPSTLPDLGGHERGLIDGDTLTAANGEDIGEKTCGPTTKGHQANMDEDVSMDPGSPLASLTPSVGHSSEDELEENSLDVEVGKVGKVGESCKLRQSSRLLAAAEKAAEKAETEKPSTSGSCASEKPRTSGACASGSRTKRKASEQQTDSRPKKAKIDHLAALRPDLSEVEKDPPKKSDRTLTMHGYRPAGDSLRTADVKLHVISEHAERPMLEGLQQSMDAINNTCVRNGKHFRHHVPGKLPTRPPAADEFDLYVIGLKDWTNLSSSERVALWGTGCDIYVAGLTIGDPYTDVGERLRCLHRLDEPMEVQVPGLRKPVYDTEDVSNDDEEDDGDGGDYTKINRTTTLRTFLEHAEREDGIVLNALKLPSSNSTQNNPLSGTGLDLEDVAYRQTKGIATFATEALPIEQLYWEIAGTAHTVTLRHYDPTGTRIHVRGPGEKLWPRRRNQDVEDAGAFQDWDPDKPDFSSVRYEGIVLPPEGGTLLMQSKEHIVIGLAPEEDGLTPQIDPLKATLVTGGHFFAASTMRHSLCVHLHLVMMEHVLTNVDADGQWKIFVRICAFWLNVTQNCPHEDRQSLRAYIPRLDEDDARGWTDIICLACVILLATCFDKRHYQTTGVPDIEMLQREQVCKMYKDWRQWFSQNYTGIRDGTQIDWEEDVFSPLLLHLAGILLDYHEREAISESSGYDVLLSVPHAELKSHVRNALQKYRSGLGARLDRYKIGHTRFFLFAGSDIRVSRHNV